MKLRKQLLIDGYTTVIEKTFEMTKGNLCIENIKMRLTVINSLFSTNILKNHGALDELSATIYKITDLNDDNMINKATNYLENRQSRIVE